MGTYRHCKINKKVTIFFRVNDFICIFFHCGDLFCDYLYETFPLGKCIILYVAFDTVWIGFHVACL